jgi:hypothetical protein
MKVVPLLLITLAACTTLGPMPATTGISALPNARPGVEAQAGFVPAFFLSKAVQDKAGGAVTSQLSALVEPDRWLGIPGLILGARLFGQSGDTPGEPYIGYRRQVDDDIAVAGILYGTSKQSTAKLASYHATRVGGEAAIDAKLWAPAPWLGVHAQGSVSATVLSASGTYCVDSMGIAKDCDTTTPANNTMLDGTVSGAFPAATATLAVDFHRREGTFHGARISALAAAGQMPLVQSGMQQATGSYFSVGLLLTLGLGAE